MLAEQVSEEGEVLYVFPKDYRAKLAGKSFRMRIEPAIQKAKVQGSTGDVICILDPWLLEAVLILVVLLLVCRK